MSGPTDERGLNGRKPRSRKQEQMQFAAELRAQGKSWAQVASAMRGRYRVNARVAFRLAHGWSQREAADVWNARWPDEPKTHKNFSTWELWPATTGHSPSLDTLDRLAQIYGCAVADLLADLPDHGAPTARTQTPVPAGPGGLASDIFADPAGAALAPFLSPELTGTVVHRLNDIRFEDLAEEIVMWVQRAHPGLNRRELLTKISAALTVAAATPLLDMADAEERERVAAVLDDPRRLDVATVAHTEQAIQHYRRQADILGPQVALQTAMAQRQVIADLAMGAPAHIKSRILTLYAELGQLAGWQLFDLGDYRAAQYYYDDARTAAHDADNVELVTYILCVMSQMATWQGKPRTGIDHAIAAQAWAAQTDSPAARAYAADVAARAYASDGREEKARHALDQEHTAVRELATQAEADRPVASWWYFYDESFYWGTKANCALTLGAPEQALHATARSLPLIDPRNVTDHAHTLAFRGQAHIQQGDIAEAVRLTGDVARLGAATKSLRIVERVQSLRTELAPWQRTRAVRRLDDHLRAYRMADNGSTNRS